MLKITNFTHYLNKTIFLLGVALAGVTTSAWGQSAPALRAVVSADAAPEAMSQLFAKLGDGERTISVPGAAWLQLQFSEVRLGPDGVLTITDSSGESQTFSQAQIDAWGGLSAMFNGSALRISLKPGKGATEPVSAIVKDIIIGLPASAVSGAELVTPQPLRNLLGPDIKRFIPDDLRGLWKEGAAPRQGAGTEAICGSTDDRIASTNPRVGRIMPVGCTGWLIDGDRLLTAGHCINAATQTIQFNVPASQANGTPVAPLVRDQYRVITESIVSENAGVGKDWAVFQVLPNTQTGLMPAAAQGATFQLSNTDNPAQARITGYGVDGPAPDFGASGPRNAQNQTQQTHVGTLSQNTGGATSGVLRYDTDTQGGNSGSPVIVAGGNVAIGIHTNGGCTSTGGTNAGTSFRYDAPWTAITTRSLQPMVFEHNDYDGRLQVLDVGRHDLGQLSIGNDVISSVRIPPGWRVTLYQHAGFQGTTKVLTANTPALPDFNDMTSSIVVEAWPVVFEHIGYAGRLQVLDVGRHDLGQLSIGNDVISSVRIPPGWRVTLYQHAGFQGATKVLTANTPALPDFNDMTSSIVVEKNSLPVVFEHNDYAGRLQAFDVGRHDLGQLSIGNDVISSVKVPTGWNVTLYRDHHFQGATKVLTANTPALPDFNDMASSIVVENLHVTVPYVREIAPGNAAKLLEDAGLVPEFTGSTCSKVGAWVFSQSPKADMRVLPSSIVRMSCRTGPIP